MAVNELKRKYDIRVFILDAEKKLLSDPVLNSSNGLIKQPYTTSADVFLEDNDSVVLAGLTIKVIATPGHTVGGACYHLSKQKILFSGDTLFYESIGRSDLPTGDSDLLIKSVRTRLAVLPEDTFVLPGHGVTTTIGHEKRCNSYMRSNKYNE
jgi:glyoxylase-like metal-dependent hydrolase (beta-lactamase superfamily II)